MAPTPTTQTAPTGLTPTAQTRTTRTLTATASTRARASSALARCIDPVAGDEFLATHWEQQPLAVPRAEDGRFDDLLTVADVERRLSDGSARYPAFRLVRDGGQVARTEYSSDLPWRPDSFPGVADPARIAALFERGATIVLQALHHNWLPLAHFCRELERELEHPAQANAYYTPRRAQGFAVHHDTHDVFVLQVAGEKHWRVYQPLLELPLKDQRYTAALGAHGSPVLELTLRAGDTLYLPRGWLHDALTSDSDSLHITVGLNVYTWLDAFRDAVEQLASDVELR